jgi:hypothetical protein
VKPKRLQPWFWTGLAALAAAGLATFAWKSTPTGPSPAAHPPAGPEVLQPVAGLPWFEEVAEAAGVNFVHFDPATPTHYIHETMGSGLAWIDYDNDGWLDLLCIQDGPLRPGPKDPRPTCKLYRNNGDGTFTDVTEQVGLARTGFNTGVAVGDYDNDGYDDLVITHLGGLALYHNEPDGRGGRHFVDVTARSGLVDPHWATSCAWGDVDGDGLLDLYVCNYLEVDLDHYQPCRDKHTGLNFSCPPSAFPHVTHRLFHNNGDGTFTDVSRESGIAAAPPAPGLAVVMLDLDGDGKIDIYVANDKKPAYLFHNQGGGRFVEKALLQGCGLGPEGLLMAGMCAEAGDVDGSGRPSLFVTNFFNLPNVLFLNQGNLFFQDWSHPSGLGGASFNRLSFGAAFLDADLDGNLDLIVANGHIHRNNPIQGTSYAQEPLLFRGDGTGHFADVSASSGPYFHELHVGRGVAWADYDNDGLPDVAISHVGGPPALLHNATATTNAWVRLELVGDGKKSNRNAIGARVEVAAGGTRRVRWIHGGGSYLSAGDRRLLVGLGKADKAERVTVVWPSGRRQEFRDLPARRWYRLHESQDAPEVVNLSVKPAAPK